MINLDFNQQLLCKGRNYEMSAPRDLPMGNRFVYARGNRIPFIACFTGTGSLQFTPAGRIYRRLLDTDMILKVFMSGSHVSFVPIRKHSYYVGKGILLDEHLKILAMLTVSEEFYHYFRRVRELTEEHVLQHFTLVVNHAFESGPDHRTLHGKFRKCYKGASFNINFTNDPEFDSFVRVSHPAFANLQERQAFISRTVASVFSELLT